MWLILAAGLLIPFVYFGYLMSRLDRFLARNALQVHHNSTLPAAIVLGETKLADETAKLLKKDNIYVYPLTEPFLLKREGAFLYLFALSERDADNLVLCKIGKKVYGIEKVVSLCNDKKNEGIFMNEKICYLLKEEATAEFLCQIMLREQEVKPW